MELFERIQHVVVSLDSSQTKFAESINIHPRTLNGWMNIKSQNNFWPILPKILKTYPRISRQWLYFEEGPMFIGHGIPFDQPVPLQIVQQAIEQMAQDATGINKTIYQLIAGQPLPEDPDATAKIRRLENELFEERKLNRQLTARLLMEEGTGSSSAGLKAANEQP